MHKFFLHRPKLLIQLLTILHVLLLWSITPSFSAATIYFDLVIDESRGLLYGSDRVGGCIDVISTSTLNIVDTLDLGSLSKPSGMDISPDGNELAVALNGNSEIAIIDLETLQVSGSLVPSAPLSGPNLPFDVVYGRPGRLYSVGNPGSGGLDNVHAFDTINKIELGKSTEFMRAAPRLAITGDNNTLYVSQVIFSPQKIYRFDISTDIPVQTAAAPHGPVNVNTLAVKPDGSRVYSSRGQVWSIYLTSQLGSFSPRGEEIEYSNTLQRFFITSGANVYEFDADTYELVRVHKLSWTAGVARVNASGTYLYVSTDLGMESRSLNSNCFFDNDKDGYGTTILISDNGDGVCKTEDNESEFDTDCEDSRPDINPGVSEIPGDFVDQNCDGLEDCYEDFDLDGYGSSLIKESNDLTCSAPHESSVNTDCDDHNSSINPGIPEIWYDGTDSNCDGANDYDADGDTYVNSDYDAMAGGTAPNIGDCNDGDASIYPSAFEIPNDGIDQDCNGVDSISCFLDYDEDGYGMPSAFVFASDGSCDTIEKESSISGDCNDGDASINPGASEIWYDGIDSNCDGANDYDADRDTYVNSDYNLMAGGTAPNISDCDDGDASINPGTSEIWYDGIDSNCDGANDYDADGDTYVNSSYDAMAGGTSPNTGDCDDADADINPGVSEICDSIDNNCDGQIDENIVCGDAFWNLVLPAILNSSSR